MRKCPLKEYKLSVVRPVLLHFDRLAYLEASCKPLPELGLSFGAFLARPTRIPVDLLKFDSGPGCWRWYRLWAVCRMTGCWPLPVFGGMEAPPRLAMCRGCGDGEISVVHILCISPALASLREGVRGRGRLPLPSAQSAFLLGLFREGPAPATRALHIEYVGRALGFACGPDARVDASLESELTSLTSADTLLRLEAERVACASPATVLGGTVVDEL